MRILLQQGIFIIPLPNEDPILRSPEEDIIDDKELPEDIKLPEDMPKDDNLDLIPSIMPEEERLNDGIDILEDI
jgi:hypothetical protein